MIVKIVLLVGVLIVNGVCVLFLFGVMGVVSWIVLIVVFVMNYLLWVGLMLCLNVMWCVLMLVGVCGVWFGRLWCR